MSNIATMSVRVLNASYMELGVTRLGRAMALVSSGRAVVEEQDDSRIIRSGGGLVIPFPRVIRLLTFLNVPFVVTEEFWSRQGVLRRDDYKCGYCLEKATTIDHIIPRSRGGENSWSNTVACCAKDNRDKADMMPEDFHKPLIIKPITPTKIYLRSGKKPRKKRAK